MKAVWLALLLYGTTVGIAGAQSDPAPGFPSKPIRWIVGFAPEDATKYVMDQVARVRGLIKTGMLTPE